MPGQTAIRTPDAAHRDRLAKVDGYERAWSNLKAVPIPSNGIRRKGVCARGPRHRI